MSISIGIQLVSAFQKQTCQSIECEFDMASRWQVIHMYIAEEVGPMAALCPLEELRQASDFQRKKNTFPIAADPSLL